MRAVRELGGLGILFEFTRLRAAVDLRVRQCFVELGRANPSRMAPIPALNVSSSGSAKLLKTRGNRRCSSDIVAGSKKSGDVALCSANM